MFTSYVIFFFMIKITDSHVHLGLWENPDFFGRELGCADLFKSYDKFGIFGAVVMPTDRAKNGEILNSLKEFPSNRYKFTPWIKPGSKDAMKFCKDNLKNIAGLKFHPSLDRTKITDNKYADFLKLALDNDLPLIVHCGRWQEIAGYEYPLEIAVKYPQIKILLSHMGGDTPKLAFGAIEKVKNGNLDNIFFDTAGFREYWVIEKGVEKLGSNRFLFASDYPLGHPVSAIELIKHLEIPDSAKEDILGRNVLDLFNWEAAVG